MAAFNVTAHPDWSAIAWRLVNISSAAVSLMGHDFRSQESPSNV